MAVMSAFGGAAIEHRDIDGILLIENAGQVVCHLIMEEFGMIGMRFVVFCRPGNDLGGPVVARRIRLT